jgi:sulfite exporter TauE/SafE
MLMFGVGAAAPLVVLGMLSREVLVRMRGRLVAAGTGVKVVLGLLMLLIGVSIVTGLNRHFEAILVDASPQWLTELTTRF